MNYDESFPAVVVYGSGGVCHVYENSSLLMMSGQMILMTVIKMHCRRGNGRHVVPIPFNSLNSLVSRSLSRNHG